MTFKPYPKYKASGVEWLGDVPDGWDVVRLKHACLVFPSNVDKKMHDGEIAVRLCNYTDVYYNDVISEGLKFMAASATAEQIAKFTLRAGDTIITKDSETADDIAIAAYVPQDMPGIVCGYHLSMVRPIGGTCGAFMKRFFDSSYAKSSFAIRANGLTRVGLGQYALDNVEMALPSSDEQVSIAAFLDRETAKIDTLIAKQEAMIDLLREKRQAVISHAVTKGLDQNVLMKPSGVEWLGDVPKHWTVPPLRAISQIVRGASPRPAGDPTFFNGEYKPWVTVGEITKDETMHLSQTSTFLTEIGAAQSRLFSAGTLLLSNSGATLGVPKILVVDACANDGVVGFERLSEFADIQFVYYYLASLTQNLRERIKQGAGQPNLNTDIVKEIRIGLPPLQEQRNIVAHLRSAMQRIDVLIAKAQQAIALQKEHRTALISAAVTGKIDVRANVAETRIAA